MNKTMSILLMCVLLQACGNNTDSADANDVETEEQIISEIPEHAEDEMGMAQEEYFESYTDKGYVLKDGEQSGVYHLVAVEDGVYPIATLHAVRHNETDTSYFNLMFEGGFTGMNAQELYEAASTGKYAFIAYADNVDLYPESVVLKGASDITEGKKVSGKLIAHKADMGGDLPGHFRVQMPDGTQIEFTDYWDESLLKMNGKQVDVHYYEHHTLDVKHVSIVN